MEIVKAEAKPVDPVPAPVVSPELMALRKEVNFWVQVANIIGDCSIKAKECLQARDLLDRLEIGVKKAMGDVEAQVALEESLKTKAG